MSRKARVKHSFRGLFGTGSRSLPGPFRGWFDRMGGGYTRVK